MAEDWAIDVRKYAPDAEDAVIAGIVRHCGIALRNRDSSLVSFSDPAETARVRDGFCRKKLGLTDPDPVVDAAIAKVGERMKGDTTKNRVTVYYLLAEAFGKLGLFGAAAAASAAAAEEAPETAGVPLAAAAAAPMMAAAAAPAAAAPAAGVGSSVPAAPVRDRDADQPTTGFVLAGCGLLAAIVIGAAVAGGLITGGLAREQSQAPATIAPQTPEALAAALVPAGAATAPAAAVPTGSGVVAQQVEGKPMVSVYFDTAKTDIAPDFPAATAPVKAYVDGHPGARVAVSGYNDPRGDAAFNAELSKNRAKSVRDALVVIGIPVTIIDLVKPADTTDAQVDQAQARRVDIFVVEAQ